MTTCPSAAVDSAVEVVATVPLVVNIDADEDASGGCVEDAAGGATA